jgi:ABC-type antimicrobial peptide transport system permease subunit
MTRAQSRAPWQIHWSTVVVRTAGDPDALLPAVRQAVWALDPALPLSAETTLDRLVAGSVATERLRTSLLVAFAVVATLLAALGLYGVLAYLVVQRRFEMAVRMALGARRGRVVGLVVHQGLSLVVAGVVLGSAVALALSRLLAGLLYRVAPTDPGAFVTVALLMLLVGLAASWLPARRASRVEPARALRGG